MKYAAVVARATQARLGRSRDRGWQGARLLLALAVLVPLVLATVPAGAVAPTVPGGRSVSVIVRTTPGAGARVEGLVGRLGGTVGRRIAIIDGFAATVPASAVPRLQGPPGWSR